MKSVLNTDAFDRLRFERLFEMSENMQKIEWNGRNTFPSIHPLMGDIWASLFKMKPEILAEVPDDLQMNKQLMERIMTDKGFEEFREYTRLDDLTSALGTIKYSETVLKWIEDQVRQNQALENVLQQMMQGSNQHDQQASQALANALEQYGQSLTEALQSAAEETIQAKENLKSLLSGVKAGSGEAELKKVPLRDQLKLAEHLSHDWKLKGIAEWAGRMKLIAQKKQQSKHRESIDRSGVTIGKQVEKLLPSEFAAIASPQMRLDFLRRFAEGRTLQYDSKGKEQLGKGPIVLCLDQSGSMTNQDTIAKGFTLALMSIARRQSRDFALILFSDRAREPLVFRHGKITVDDMIRLATTFLDGGTNFVSPLRKALNVIQSSRFRKADVVFVTDGEDRLTEDFAKHWNELKESKDFRVLSLLIGTEYDETVKLFSDRVVKASSLSDEAAYAAFEI
jgi:uncharacterized protein with von Willebrand factor type A (vWA) domain